jgi:tetratricopeptide (TPR) repeat protein
MNIYRNEQYGFEIEIPEDLALDSGRLPLLPAILSAVKLGWIPSVNVQFGNANVSINIAIESMSPELPPDLTELMFALQAQDMEYVNCEFGRISLGDKVHTWARYELAGKLWSKKYMLVLGGKGYAITVGCNDQNVSLQREGEWDASVSSFRLLAPIDESIIVFNQSAQADRAREQLRDVLEMRAERRGRNLSYGRAMEAIEDNRYSDARVWLEKCLHEFEDNETTSPHLIKQLVAMSKKLGDKKRALRYRRELKRLKPSDYANRMELVELLAGFGYSNEAMSEAEELVALMPDASAYQNLKTNLANNPGPNYRLRFVLLLAYFLFVDMNVLLGGIILKAPWLAGILCQPAAHYLNLSGRWVGLTRNSSDWITVALSLSTLLILVLKGNLNIFLFIFLSVMVFPILKDNALRD